MFQHVNLMHIDYRSQEVPMLNEASSFGIMTHLTSNVWYLMTRSFLLIAFTLTHLIFNVMFL